MPTGTRRHAGWRSKFGSFRGKLLLLLALAVSIPAVLACLILGYQLDAQARKLFASELAANLETFSLILQDSERSLYEGLSRTAADNTLQVTLELDITPQLAKYIDAQRQVLRIAFLGVYDRQSRITAFSSGDAEAGQGHWRIADPGEPGGADCVALRDVPQQLVRCREIYFLLSVVPVIRLQDAALGDATARSQGAGLLGYLLGGTPLASPALIASLQARKIAHPLVWVGDDLVYSNIPAGKFPPPAPADGSAQEYKLGQTAYLGAARTTSIGARPLVYAVVAPLAPLQQALLGSVMTVAATGIVLVVLTLLAGGFMANRLLLPIRQLREGAARVGKGELDHRIDIHTGDELEALADEFNHTTAQLQDSQSNLEQKVESRTAELTESLERQTATAEILRVISSSPRDLRPVFDAILEKAMHLCEAHLGMLSLSDGEKYEHVAQRGASPEFAEWAFRGPFVPDPSSSVGRLLKERKPIHHQDLRESVGYREGVEGTVKYVEVGGARSYMAVPMLKEDRVVGGIIIYRPEVRPFTQKQIDLVATFANQAVIAIENVRLFKELEARTEDLTRSVEEMRALGEVGRAVSSTLDLQTVLVTIITHAVELSKADAGGTIYEFDEATGVFEPRANFGVSDAMVAMLRESRIRLGETTVGTCAVRRAPYQIPDMEQERDNRLRDLLLHEGIHAVLAVPLLREERVIGALSIRRRVAGEFPQSVVTLLQTFAAQSVLAIQNARLFQEIQAKSEELKVASRHKSDFLASMSHELRTPLNAILGFNEMILGQIYGEVPADMQAPLAQIQTSGKHLLRLINNVLDLAKIEAGRMELALSDYSVHDTVESVRSTLRPLAADKGLEFLATLPADIPLAYGDAGRITQCLMNLAGNSLKFTKAGKVEITVECRGELLVYRVADTGMGIPPDKIGSLFTEFKQTDASIASEYGGTGLGLSISKKFIEMHGGRIWVESELDKGSAFIFEIPLRLGEGAAT